MIQSIINGTSHDSIFQILLFFPHLVIFLQYERPVICAKLVHQSSPAEMAYQVQESQIFAA